MVNDAIRVDVRKVVLDSALAVFVQSLVILIPLYAVPVDSPFSCHDQTLMYPYVESTISRRTSMVSTFALGVLALSFLEWLEPSTNRRVFLGKFHFPTFAYNSCCAAAVYLFGLSCCQVVVLSLQYTVGRHRPYFLTMCQPDVCRVSNGSEPFAYYKTFACTNPSYEFHVWDLNLMRTSFPSGHASIGTFCSLYLAVYFQKKISTRISGLFKHFLQFMVVVSALYMSMTRISDHKHHWGDVLGGTLIGAVCVVLTVKYIATPSEDYQPVATELIAKSEPILVCTGLK